MAFKTDNQVMIVKKTKSSKLLAAIFFLGTGLGLWTGYSCQAKKIEQKAEEKILEIINNCEAKIAETKQKSIDSSVFQEMLNGHIRLREQVSDTNKFFAEVKKDKKSFQEYVEKTKKCVLNSRLQLKKLDYYHKGDIESLTEFFNSYSEDRKDTRSMEEAYKICMFLKYNKNGLSKEEHVKLVEKVNGTYIAACDNIIQQSTSDIESLNLIMNYLSRYGDKKDPEVIIEGARQIVNKQEAIKRATVHKKTYTENQETDWVLPVNVLLRNYEYKKGASLTCKTNDNSYQNSQSKKLLEKTH